MQTIHGLGGKKSILKTAMVREYPLRFIDNGTPEISPKFQLEVFKQYKPSDAQLYELLMIDPGVTRLQKTNEYTDVDALHNKVSILAPNEFMSIDYPSALNPSMAYEFIRRSNDNNFKYANNPNYICAVQYHRANIRSFKENLDKLRPIWEDNPKKMMAIGNILRIIQPNKFTDDLFDIIWHERHHIHYIHFYGLAKELIYKYIPRLCDHFQVAFDSTKWIQPLKYPCNFKKEYDSMSKEDYIRFCFHMYFDEIAKFVQVEW